MMQSNTPSGEEPKKKPLKLLLKSGPVAAVETSVGCIYLYPLRLRDMNDFGKLEPADAVSLVRDFLSSIGSMTVVSDEAPERIPLDPEIAKGLSDDEIEQISEVYVQWSQWNSDRKGLQVREPVVREAGESASTYLIRLVKDEVAHDHQTAKQLHEKLFGSSRGLFDQVRQSYTELGATVKAFESISRPKLESSPPPAYAEITNHFLEHNARMARERAEELEMVRLTGKMTAESAKTLKDLAEAATTLMEQFDERDQKTDKATSTQISIAVWSVGITAVLALLALVISGLAYLQDRDNNHAADLWQEKLLSAIDHVNQELLAVESENQFIREKMKSMDDRISEMEVVQHTVNDSIKTDLAKQRNLTTDSLLSPP